MRRATAVNLVLLGGGLTLIGTLAVVSEQRSIEACQERQAREPPGHREDCRTPQLNGGGHGGSGGHFSGSRGITSSDEDGRSSTSGGEIARGGFGGFGGGEGGGE